MRPIVTYGYMLSGTGSNVYVQSRCAVETDGPLPIFDEYPGCWVKSFQILIGEKG